MSYSLILSALVLLAAPPQEPVVGVGSPAPGFTLRDDRGITRSLADFRGKFVVLEWHEKGCPYVAKHYRSGHMQKLQQDWMRRGVVWLLLSSSAEGSHSYLTPDESRAYLGELKATPTAMLLDTDGRAGRLYGSLTALHMVVIDPAGKVAYNGAIDDKPTTQAADLTTAKNYVEQALSEVTAGRPVSVPATVPYGCSIHYASK
jgi:peroxiredoxin